MIFLTGNETTKRTITEYPGIEWTIGMVAPDKLREGERAVRRAYAMPPDDGGGMSDAATDVRAEGWRTLIRHGVRACSTASFATATGDVLDDAALDRIARVDGGLLMAHLANVVVETNHITKDELLGFR